MKDSVVGGSRTIDVNSILLWASAFSLTPKSYLLLVVFIIIRTVYTSYFLKLLMFDILNL